MSLAVLPRERLLLRQATQICRISGWFADDTTSHAHVDTTHYYWLSNETLLYETEDTDHVRLWQLNTRTGRIQQSTPLLNMQKQYPVNTYSFSLSPDRQCALWQPLQQHSSLNVVTRVDGSIAHVWESPNASLHSHYSTMEWLGNGHSCIGFVTDIECTYNQVRFRTTDNPRSILSFPIGEHSRFNENGFSNLGYTTVAIGHVFRYSGGIDPATGKMELGDIDLTQSPWREQQRWLTVPAHAEVYALYFHPRQPRIAMLIAYPSTVSPSFFCTTSFPVFQYGQSGDWDCG